MCVDTKGIDLATMVSERQKAGTLLDRVQESSHQMFSAQNCLVEESRNPIAR
jgi:hypothetical protein